MSPDELRALLARETALWASLYYLISQASNEHLRALYGELRLSGTSSAVVGYLEQELANRGVTP